MVGGVFSLSAFAQQYGKGNLLPVQSTYEVKKSDSKAEIIKRAAHVVPTASQYEALKNEFIAFIHFGPNTFTKMEWGSGKEDPAIFDLKNLDTDQWCASMKDAGMKKVIITVKHHDGFVLWQSRYTDHGIMSTGFQDGKGDILRELSASCEKYGLKLGVYLSPADLFQIENEKGLYGNLSPYTERTIPRKVEGRPFANKKTFKFLVDDYNEYFLNQLFELLTEYGPIHEVWFDGAHPKTKGGQKYNYTAWRELIKTLVPNVVIFGKEDIRWCGNEAGGTRNTEWNVIPYDVDPRNLKDFIDLTDEDLGSRERLFEGNFLHYQQAETNTSIREGWFYRDDVYQKVRSADDVFDIYERAVGGNSTFLLNIPPNREGRFSDEDVAVLKEVGQRIREGYTTNLLAGAKGPNEVLDNVSSTTYLMKTLKDAIEIQTAKPIRTNRFMIQEAIDTNGERIEEHALDVWIDGAWKEVATGTNVGYKRILRFPEVETNRFRLRVLNSRALPVLSEVGAFYVKVRPPQLMFSRDLDGALSIVPYKNNFGWNPHGEDALKNMQANYAIHYTEDGSEPTAKSAVYNAAFTPAGKYVKAIAIDANGLKGAVAEAELGLVKKNWKIVEVSSQEDNNPANLLADEKTNTYWQSKATGASQFVVIDLGASHNLTSFAYTPQTRHSKGMLAKGTFEVSADGQNWTMVEAFEFGNLINDPSKRFHRFAKPVEAKFVRIKSTEITGGGDLLSVAEFDFL